MNVRQINDQLAGEQVIATDPTLAPAVDAGWRRRLNSYTGRSLSNIALMTEQNERSGRLTTHGQVISPGVVSGLEVGVEGTSAPTVARVRLDGGPEGPPIEAPHASFFHVAAGTGLTVSGEDVVVPRPLRVNVQDVRVYAPVSVLDPGAAGSSSPAGTLAARRLDGPLRDVLARGVKLPSVAILVLQPIVAELLDVPSSTDPCAASPGDDAFNDWQLVDGCRLVLYFWPDEWLALPALDTRGRNRLAYTVFEAEARSSGLPSPWTAPDLPELPLPWLELGVPIALVSFDGAWAPRWVDRSSVVRQGGRLRGHRPWPANAGSPELWEARLQQFAEQMADPALAGAAGDALAQQFRYLPPVGLLPRDLIDFRTGQISFFPAYYATSARPVPLEQLDLVTEGAAALAPFDLFAAEAVEVLVPVPQVWYEPELLMTPQVDPAFLAAIADFSLQRFQWLQRRADVRAKASVIGQAVTGTAPQYPTPDPDQLDDESVPPATPYAGTQVHLSPAAAGYHAHAFSGATTTVAPTAADLLFGYVYPDPDNPPAAVMLTWSPNGEDWAHGAYWGTLPPSDGGPPFNARELGPLPPPGRWTRLEVPAALVNVAGSTLTGMAFAVVGGSAAWGRAGLATPQLGRAAAETTSIVDALPAGAAVVSPPGVTDEHWSWSDLTVQPFPLEDAFGTTIVNGAPVPAALADVRGKLPDYVQSDFDSYMNPQPANAGGLRGLVNDLQEKVRQSDDAIDFGFLRVQTDIYRVRQLMLGNVDATRLATSPALATIAQGQSAIATREDLQNYFKAAKGAIPTSTVSSVSAGSIASTVTGGTVESVPPSSVSPGGGDGVNPAELALSTDTGTATDRFPAGSLPFRTRAASRLVSASVPATVMMKPATLSESVMTPVTTDQTAIRVASVSAPQATVQMTPSAAVVAASVPITSMINLASTQTLPALHSHVSASSIDVVEQSPIVGAGYDFRSVTVAQRLEDPQAPEARSFTVASKYDVISSLHAIPINLDTVPIPGVATFKVGQDGGTPQPQYDNTGQPVRAPIQFKDLDGGGLTRVLNDPSPLNADEAGFFAAGILNLDHTIATLRGVEGRIQAYRSAIELCSQLLTTLEGFAGGTASRLTAIGNSLTETRHNISVARSLLADETARIDGIKQRRETVLAEHVPFLAFRRPRVSDVLRDSPARFLDPGLMQAPGPACLTQPVVVPPEIRAMVDLLHEAPVRWYPPILPLIDRFDRFDTLQDVLGNARNRAALQIPIRQAFLPSLAGQSQLGSAIAGVLTAQRQAVMQTRVALRQFDGAATGALSWRNLRDSARSLLSLGDLIDGGHGRSDVSQDAAAALDGVAHVAGCLYAHVGAVLPAIRLLWAERLSQYESSVNLRNLSSLPRWGELDGYSRQEMQGLVDWLYQQVDIFQADATSIMNDLVRVCILLASHAPVNEIIAGQVAQNTTVQPGGRVTLNIDPLRVRVGMQVLMYAESKVVAQGVVEDLSAGQVAARVVQAAAPTVQLTQGAAVHFAEPDAFARNLLTTGLSRLGSA